MERNIPQIGGVGKFYPALALVTFLLVSSSGEKWNLFYEIFGIMFPTLNVILFGVLVAITLGWFDKIEGKTNYQVVVLYALGFLMSYGIAYWFFNVLNFSSIKGSLVYVLLIVAVLPGFGLLKIYQFFYNRKLENTYWEEYDKLNYPQN